MPAAALRTRVRATVAGAILTAAEAVALAAGLDGVTVAAVAAEAGVAVGTLYNHFADREAIIAALFKVRRAALRPLITAASDATRALPFEDRLRALMRQLLVGFGPYEAFLRLSILADSQGSRLRPRDPSLAAPTLEALEDCLRAGARRKLFPVRMAPAYARMLHGQLRSIFVWRLTAEPALAADGDFIVDAFLRGVARPA